MDFRGLPSPAGIEDIADEAMATVERWLSVTDVETPAAELKLARLLNSAAGSRFAVDFVEKVLSPADVAVAGKNLEHVSRELPANVTWLEGIGTQFAGGFAPIAPSAIVPLARENFLKSVGHLFLRGNPDDIEKQLAALESEGGIRPTVAPLTAVASGDRERHRQVVDIHEILRRGGVDAVSIRPAAFLGRPRLIDLDAVVESAVEILAPLYETAANAGHPKFIDLDVAVVDELEVSLRVFERMLSLYPHLDVGISLPACLPESLPALVRVIDRVAKRRAAGGAGATVRFTRGEHLLDERERASVHGWPAAPFATRQETDAQFIRLLDYALTREHTSVVRVISATHNLFTVAFAWRLARARGIEDRLEHEFMLGVTSKHRDVVKRDVGGIRLFTPIVPPRQLALAAPYLVRRIHDFSTAEGYLASNALAATATAISPTREGEEKRNSSEQASFRASVDASKRLPVATHRTQSNVRTEVADFSVAATRDWAMAVLERAKDSASGEALLARSMIGTARELEHLVTETVTHAETWGDRRGSTRATVLESVAEVLAEWRGLLVETAVSESAVTLQEADAEVTVAIQVAIRAAQAAREIGEVLNARFTPPRLVVVVSSRTSPIADLADNVLSALAAGSAVILKTAPETRRSSAVFVETLIAGGIPPGLVTILDDEGEFAQALISDPRVDHVLHTGSRHAAKLFHSWRSEAQISSTTGGRGSIIVTPNAHLETAVDDILQSVIDHAGQSPTAIGSVILVGTAGDSARFLGRLNDAMASIPLSTPGTPGAGISALARPATDQQRLTLETLEENESWGVRPRQVDTRGRLWSAGVRDNVAADSPFCKADNRVPVVGIVRARSLAEAIDIQNAHGFGLVAGIYSLDEDEVRTWLGAVEAGVACVNRSTNSVLHAKAPIDGWSRSIVGTVRTGGQDAVVALGQWNPVDIEPGATVTLNGISESVARLISAAQSSMEFAEFDWVRSGALSDGDAWRTAYAKKQLVRSEFEQIDHRYRAAAVTVRLSEGGSLVRLVRVLAAAALTQSAIAISSSIPLHSDLIALFGQRDSPVAVAEVLVESDARWRARVQAGEIVTSRIRLIDGDRQILARVLHGQPGIAVYGGAVTASGRVELLPFLRAQSICVQSPQVFA